MREEFEALGSPPFEKRGAVANEYIRAFRELWTQDNPTFEGTYCRFSNVEFAPKPVQKPHPPIWTGGESPVSLRRAGRLADGVRRPLTGTPAQIADDIKRYEEVGVHHMMLSMVVRRPGVTVQQSLERMERFATKVMPLV
jgi:alkanesulfonate monooxygenase SsuD/methylene tetrahydromethanopterin reductase-like flavin-dependent oxidoreductase (luciferase family)